MARIQLAILATDCVYHYYPVPDGQGWKVDPASRCIIVGTGVPRVMIPLDNVRSWTITDLDAPCRHKSDRALVEELRSIGRAWVGFDSSHNYGDAILKIVGD